MAVIVSLATACSGGSDEASDAPPSADAPATTVEEPEPATTLPPGAAVGLDDLNQDGQRDLVCGTRDFGAGLVLQIPCEAAGYASDPSEGVTRLPNALSSLPSISDQLKAATLSEVSADAIAARDPGGKQVYVFFIQSDTLFDVGSSTLSNPARATLDGLARGIQATWPTASVQVRGHTDSTGSASANQTLSEQRASNVMSYLGTRGIAQARLSSVGLGPNVPVAAENNQPGLRENRRVELVVRLP